MFSIVSGGELRSETETDVPGAEEHVGVEENVVRKDEVEHLDCLMQQVK